MKQYPFEYTFESDWFIKDLPKPIDPWPGEAMILGGPHDGMMVKCQGRCVIMIDKEKERERFRASWNGSLDPEALAIPIIELPYERYVWYEYFWFLWFFVPIGVFVRTFAIHPSLKEAQ